MSVEKSRHFPVEGEGYKSGAVIIVGDKAVEQTASSFGLKRTKHRGAIQWGDKAAAQHLRKAARVSGFET